jgi:predicted RND superfamily exporter protein
MAFGVALVLALAGMPRFEVDTNVLHYFRPQHPIRSSLERLEEEGVGVIGADLVLDLGRSPVSTRQDLAAIEALARRLRSLPGVLGVLSVSELWRSTAIQLGTNGSEPQAVTADLAEDSAWLEIERTKELWRVRNSLLTAEGEHARVALFFPMRGYEQLEPLLLRTLAIAREQYPTAAATLTGRYPLVMSAQRSLLRTMISSLSLTAFCVLAVFLLILRRPALAIRALLPNLLPIAIVLGSMAWLSIPIDSTTMMIAAVALGLAVDDTLHTLGMYRHWVEELGPRGAAIESLTRGAGAYIATAAVLVAGFLTCSFAGLVPVSRFGSLTALAVVAALAADLLLVPSLLGSASLGSSETRQGAAGDPRT